jgi:aconitate hydratase
MYLGVRIVIAKSIERIHMANLVNFGILPLVFVNENDYNQLENGDELLIAGTGRALKQAVIHVTNVTHNYEFAVTHSLTPRQIENLLK